MIRFIILLCSWLNTNSCRAMVCFVSFLPRSLPSSLLSFSLSFKFLLLIDCVLKLYSNMRNRTVEQVKLKFGRGPRPGLLFPLRTPAMTCTRKRSPSPGTESTQCNHTSKTTHMKQLQNAQYLKCAKLAHWDCAIYRCIVS